MKILVTGGWGFIGKKLTNELIKLGHHVTILDNMSPQIHDEVSIIEAQGSLDGNIKFILGDIKNREDWLKAIINQEMIVHLAAQTGTGQSMYQVQTYSDVNIVGFQLLNELLLTTKHSIKKIVLASSRAIYGEGPYHCQDCNIVYPNLRNPQDLQNKFYDYRCPKCSNKIVAIGAHESSNPQAKSFYAATKYTQELILKNICIFNEIDYLILRYQNVYGEGQSLKNPYTGIISIFTERIKRNENIIIFEDGEMLRDFVHVNDVVDLTIRASMDPALKNSIVNIGSGVSISVLEVANILMDIMNKNVPLIFNGKYRLGDVRHAIADVSYAKAVLKAIKMIDIEEGLKKFVMWAENKKIKDNGYEKSIQELINSGLFK